MDFIELSSQVVLQCYGQFMDDYTKRLKESALKFHPPWHEDRNFVHMNVFCEDSQDISSYLSAESSEDVIFVKSFISLVKDVNNLKNELLKEFLPKLKYCGEVYFPQSSIDGNHILIRHVLPLYFDVLVFIKRCRQTLGELLSNLERLYRLKVPPNSKVNIQDVSFISFHSILQSVGDVLLILVSIDASIASYHRDMESKWNILKQNVLAISYENNIDQSQQNRLLQMMGEAQSELLTGLVFHNSMKILYTNTELTVLLAPIQYFLLCQIKEFEYVDDTNCLAMDNCAKVITIFVMASQIFSLRDKKVQTFVLGFAKKFPAIAVFGQIFWCPSLFIVKSLNQFSSQLRTNTIDVSLAAYTEEFKKNLISRLKDFSMKVFQWCLKMENCIVQDNRSTKLSDLTLTDLCLEGLQLSNDIKYAVCSASRLYYALQKPISKSLAKCFCKLIELLKSIHSVFHRHEYLIYKNANHAVQKISLRVLNKLFESKKLLAKELKKPTNKRLLATLEIAEGIFFGACTEDKLLLINLLSSFPCNYVNVEYAVTLMKYYGFQLDVICNLKRFLAETTMNLFGVGERSILPIYLQYLKENRSNLSRAKYVLDPEVWEDKSLTNGQSVVLKEIHELMTIEVYHPLCQEVETCLRLLAHAHLNLNLPPITSSEDHRKFFCQPPIAVGSSFFSTKHHVEKYLEKTFHDLLTVSLHDWHMYREMRSLALFKYDLQTVEDNLPCQSVSLGLDVLQIMRNINVFVSKYLYNMNNQSFVEFESNNKHLNTITIQIIASSIWTHGTGIMNTTTNFIYQYLRKRILTFSQFLFDDNIKSRLLKDLSFLNEAGKKKEYTFDRAERFIKSVNQLGHDEDGLTWLEKYRILVTQIGNALGYVRMVRAGGQHHCLEAASFLPKYLPLSFDCSKLSSETKNSVTTFQDILASIVHNLCSGAEYLKLLVEVFAQVFANSDSVHLDLFVLVVPPLTVCFVQHMVSAKERVTKKSRHGGKFTDDGFPMGLAYLLCMLGLTSQFEALHWFDMVKKKFDEEEEIYSNSAPSDYDNIKYENTRQLSLKHLNLHRKEFELLYYNIKSAQIIFQGK